MSIKGSSKQTQQLPKAGDRDLAARTIVTSQQGMWKCKRESQRTDIDGLKKGTASFDDMSWFSGGVTRKAKLGDSLF